MISCFQSHHEQWLTFLSKSYLFDMMNQNLCVLSANSWCQNEASTPSWCWSNSWRTGSFFFFFFLPHLVAIPQTQHIIKDEEYLDGVPAACLCLCLLSYCTLFCNPLSLRVKMWSYCGGLFNISSPSSVCLRVSHTNIFNPMASSHAPEPLLTFVTKSSPLHPTFKIWSLSDTAGVVATETGPSNICLTSDPKIITLFHIVIYFGPVFRVQP